MHDMSKITSNTILSKKNLNERLNLLLQNYHECENKTTKRKIKIEGIKLANKIKNSCWSSQTKYFIIKFKNKVYFHKNIDFIISLFGNRITQNHKNEKTITVTPNKLLIKKFKKNIKDKLRYHQTNKGGSIHTDGPQHENTPKFVFMAFINNENKGGETILVNGKKLFDFIKKKKPSFSNSLQKNFYFERRGFKFDNKNIFKKKIFDNKNNFSMRYLREYIDTAYKKLNKKIPLDQLNAINYLDKLLYSKKFQVKFKLNEGEIIFFNNKILAHGRTSFSLNKSYPRKILRVWFN